METAATQDLNKLAAIAECSICFETLKKPKGLPCSHTFCLECLETYSKDEAPGGKMHCPVCHQQFAIPLEGFQRLLKPFHIYQVLEGLKKNSADENAPQAASVTCTRAGSRTKFCMQMLSGHVWLLLHESLMASASRQLVTAITKAK